MRTDVIVQQALLELIDGGSGLLSDLLETNPNQDGTADMITLNASQATLTALNPSDLLAHLVKVCE